MLPRIAVIGNGQLGRMLKQAGAPMGLEVLPCDPDQEEPVALNPDDVVTVEQELWPDTPRSRQLTAHPGFVNARATQIIRDRLSEKSLLDHLKVGTAPWCNITADHTTEHLALVGEKLVIKRRQGGYDGRGQWRWQQGEPALDEWLGECIAEKMIPFDEEVSLLGARGHDGKCVFYPLTLNLHRQGILHASIGGLKRLRPLQATAEAWLSRIMVELDYVGVMAMECFVVDGTLLVNELAPRVHNSGHWTQAGAKPSQFELHLRAVADLPLFTPEVDGLSVMWNLLGRDWSTQWLAVPGCDVHWYEKEIRPGRKVGHVNLHRASAAALQDSLSQLAAILPEDERSPLFWALNEIQADSVAQGGS